MDCHFNAGEWTTLTREQRLHRCVVMANEARTYADVVTPSRLKEGYLAIAADWLALASEIAESD